MTRGIFFVGHIMPARNTGPDNDGQIQDVQMTASYPWQSQEIKGWMY